MKIQLSLSLICLVMYVIILDVVLVYMSVIPKAQMTPSCSTPAANWATLTACRTETAMASKNTPVPANSVTIVYSTPTRLAVQLVFCASKPQVIEVEQGLWRVTCDYR